MKYLMFALTLLAAPVSAQVTVDDWLENPGTAIPARDVTLDDFKWRARPLVVFADSAFDPSFIQQMELLTEEIDALIDRDIVWIFDTDPDGNSDLRRSLRPNGFGLVLIGKDGQIKLRKALPYDVREISRTIDKMPMRQLEVEERRGSQMILDN